MHIHSITLGSNNLDETVQFYTKNLGFSLISSSSDSVSFQVGHSILRFEQTEISQPNYHFAFSIPSNNIEEALQWLSSRVELIPVSEAEIIADFGFWKAKSVYFHDNNGNILECIAREGLENPSELPFDSLSILSINEIAIVSKAPLVLAEYLIKNNNLHYFSRGGKNENFVALGDEHGLIIIVKSGRNWFPTQLAASTFPTRMLLLQTGKQLDFEFS